MASLEAFQVYDALGAVVTTATPTFLFYGDRSGAARAAPTITHISNGVYAFVPSAADLDIGTAWIVTTGNFPSRYFGSIFNSDAPFHTSLFANGADSLVNISGTPPALAFYKDRLGANVIPVALVVNTSGGYLWTISPLPEVSLAGIVFDVVAPSGSFPSHYAGDLLAEPPCLPSVVVGAATSLTTTVATPFAPSGVTSTATGIFQTDLCLRHALIEGMSILRSTPWLLDSVTRGITFDPLTSKRYGQKELDQLRRWFLGTEIPVIAYRIGGPVAPSISLALVASSIDASTLGDIHYDEKEDVADGGSFVIAGPFNPAYNGFTGVMTLPSHISADVFVGEEVMDSKGQSWPILEIVSNVSPISFKLATGILAPFDNATIRGSGVSVMETQESIKMKEGWSVGIHVNTEPGHLLFLHAVVSFILLWGRESLLEARGFELSDFSSTDFSKNQAFDEENVWSRFINLNGITQSVWPKRRLQKIVGVSTRLKIIGGANVPKDFGDVNDLSWVGDQDSIG